MSLSRGDNDSGDALPELASPRTEQDQPVLIKLRNIDGYEAEFAYSMGGKLRKLMEAFCIRHHIPEHHVHICFDGERVDDDDTALNLGLEYGDCIDVMEDESWRCLVKAVQSAGDTFDVAALRKCDPSAILLTLCALPCQAFCALPDSLKGTPAHRAAQAGQVGFLRALHEMGATGKHLSATETEDGGETPAHKAARFGHADCLRVLHELGASDSLSATDEDGNGETPAHKAARFGHADCLRVLHELGASDSLSASDEIGHTPAHLAAESGHADCLRVLHELGAADSLCAAEADGQTPAYLAADSGHADCLRVLHELGASDSLSASDKIGYTPAHCAAESGHADCLRVLHELGAADSLSAAEVDGQTPAYLAASRRHVDCLRVLHELGAANGLSMLDDEGRNLAHNAMEWGATRSDCDFLRVLHEIGAADIFSATDAEGNTPAHLAALHGNENGLRILHELGAAASLSRPNPKGRTPAHIAAEKGFHNVLRVLHELGATDSLSAIDDGGLTPAYIAAHQGRFECFEFLLEHGRSSDHSVTTAEAILTKRMWLNAWLCQVVREEDGEVALSLVARRGHILDGLCAQLGVDETTGQVLQGTAAVPLDVRFEGEASGGDGLRREWFGYATAEMLDPNRGLFLSRDGNRTLQPNPDSASTAGADHLSYFALLGRIAGLALYHREPLNASWTTAFLKAAFGYEITFDDLESADPVLHAAQAKLLEMDTEDLDALCLTFVADSDEAIVYDGASKRRRETELRPGGADEPVTAGNVREYLQLYATHKLVGAIRAQAAAFRDGLGVFLDDELLSKLRSICTVAEVQLLLCGATDIDVEDWQASAQYEPLSFADSPQVTWFWTAVREMSVEDRSTLLHFCTGSMRPPATGFASLMGYNGALQRFTLQRSDGAQTGRLPTASACFNKIYLPEYATEAELRAKLRLALSGSSGFDEAAVVHDDT